MKSFKHFISEGISGTLPKIHVTYTVPLKDIPGKYFYDENNQNLNGSALNTDISHNIIGQQMGRTIEAIYGRGEISVLIDIESASQGTEDAIEKTLEEFDKLFHEFMLGEMSDHYPEAFTSFDKYVWIVATLDPSMVIDYPSIQISAYTGQKISLRNIHKQISHCRKLQISRQSFIIDGGIGLLKIKGLETLTSTLAPNTWLKIIIYNFDNGKDMLKSQEDLLEAGFKDYAKL